MELGKGNMANRKASAGIQIVSTRGDWVVLHKTQTHLLLCASTSL